MLRRRRMVKREQRRDRERGRVREKGKQRWSGMSEKATWPPLLRLHLLRRLSKPR